MKTLFLLNIISLLFGNENFESIETTFPSKQTAEAHSLNYHSNYIYSTDGQLIESSENTSKHDKFYVRINNNKSIEINLSNLTEVNESSEIGYLARILSAESLVYTKQGSYFNISMFTRVCIAESIKNRKNSDFGFYAKYNTYKSVIFYTGYATSANEFKNTQSWLNHRIAKTRFIQEVIPVAIYVYYNETDFTNNSTGFITPAKMSSTLYNKFKKRTLVEVEGIDPYYEFVFWKY